MLLVLVQNNEFSLLVGKAYRKLRNLYAYLFGPIMREDRWAKRTLFEIQGSFTNLNHPHRAFLLEKINNFQPFDTILEVGCSYGPNLFLLAKRFSKTRIFGVDINPIAIKEGKKWMAQETINNVELIYKPPYHFNNFPDKSFDIVFTDALLMYVPPVKIENMIKDIIRIARKGILFLEFHSFSETAHGHAVPDGYIRDYGKILGKFLHSSCEIQIQKIPKEAFPSLRWLDYGYLIAAKLR